MTGLPTVTVLLGDTAGALVYDVSTLVRLADPVTVTRGRGDEQGEVQPSNLQLVLENLDGRFTLGSAASAAAFGGHGVFNDQVVQVKLTVGGVTSRRFTGYVQAWPTVWPTGDDTFATAPLVAVDRFARVAKRQLRSLTAQEILADAPTFYYSLSESGGATSAADTSGNANPSLLQAGVGDDVSFGQDGATFTAGKALQSKIAAFVPTALTVECAFSSLQTVNYLVDLSGPGRGALAFEGTGRLRAVLDSGAGFVILDSVAPVNDGAVHHAAVTVTNGGTARLYVDGVEVATSGGFGTFDPVEYLALGDQALAFGFGATLDGTLADVAIYSTALSAARVAAHAQAALTGFSADSTADRITRYAGYANIPPADLALEPSALVDVAVLEITGASPVTVMQQVTEAEGGLLFVAGDGKVTLHNRSHRATQVVPDWSLTAIDIAEDASFSGDMQGVVNYATGTRPGGGTQIAQDPASIAVHEQYPTSVDLLVSTDQEVRDAIDWLVNTRSEPAPRLPSVKVDLLAQAQGQQQTWLDLELSDRLVITGLPAQAPAADLLIEGWTETVTASSWDVVLNTSPFELSQAWVLEDPVHGVLEQTTRIGY